MTEKIYNVKVFKDDAGEWWLEFYSENVRHQVTIEDVMNGVASYVNMQLANASQELCVACCMNVPVPGRSTCAECVDWSKERS